MLEVFGRRVAAIQRSMKRMVERQIFKPILARNGIVNVLSRPNWGQPETGLEDLDLRGLADLVRSKALSPLQAQNLLVKMGVPLEDVEDREAPENEGPSRDLNP